MGYSKRLISTTNNSRMGSPKIKLSMKQMRIKKVPYPGNSGWMGSGGGPVKITNRQLNSLQY
jgi:hypothetical protein